MRVLAMSERDGAGPFESLRGELVRIADALERLLALLEPRAGRTNGRREEEVEVSESDRAAARAIARRMGLIVRRPE